MENRRQFIIVVVACVLVCSGLLVFSYAQAQEARDVRHYIEMYYPSVGVNGRSQDCYRDCYIVREEPGYLEFDWYENDPRNPQRIRVTGPAIIRIEKTR